jgi:hypothetical protein
MSVRDAKVFLVNGTGNRAGITERCPERLIGDRGFPVGCNPPTQVRILPSPLAGLVAGLDHGIGYLPVKWSPARLALIVSLLENVFPVYWR